MRLKTGVHQVDCRVNWESNMPCVDDQVAAVRRALDLLDAFGIDDGHLTIAELARRTALPRTSALRLARTLQSSGYLVQEEGGTWRLGPSTAWLAARYQVAFDLKGAVRPALQALAVATGKTATFFVREANARVRLMRVEAGGLGAPPYIGEQLPLDRGSPGKVILAFTGKPGKMFDEIRRHGYHVTIGETRKRSASVSAPVFGPGWSVLGAITVSCPSDGARIEDLSSHAPAVMEAGRRLSSALMRARSVGDKIRPPASYAS